MCIRAMVVSSLVLSLLVGIASPRVQASVAVQEAVQTPPVVNVEIILDSSGSMANITDTGEIRMDAAKRVLREVTGSIPDRSGAVNVGLRVYGHEGDNTEATKALSCQASDLLVPIEGVDRPALLAAVDGAQPTGWTPIARSLSRAGKDFPEAGEGVVNAVVLLTDGVETCDGDPVKVAGDLRKKPSVSMITHVVGFGTTPEEQQVLSGIAENGGGLLLGAGNAAELRDALFSVLEELDILVGVGYVGGNAFGLVPQGEPDTISVVAQGPMDSFLPQMPFVVRNNTGDDAVGLKVSVTVRDAGGNLLGAGDANDVRPFFVRAGGLAFGSIYFSSNTIFPPDASFAFEVTPTAVQEARFSGLADLDIVEAALFENRIVGTATNGFERAVDGPLSFSAVCFDEAGNLLGIGAGSSDTGSVAPGDSQSFQVDLFAITYAGFGCPTFLVAGQGYGPSRLPTASQGGGQTASSQQEDPPPVADDGSEQATDPSGETATDGFSIAGLDDAALRTFESTPGVTDGLLAIASVVARFSSEDAADAGLTAMADRYFALHGQSDGEIAQTEPQLVSAPELGDRRLAFSWSLTHVPTGIEFASAMIAVRKGDLVYLLVGQSRNTNPLIDLADVATKIVTDEPRQSAADGSQTGGLWDLLPTLDEVPFGLAITEEKIPEDWGPVPAGAARVDRGI